MMRHIDAVYEIGARKMAESETARAGATSETMRNIATFLDALTLACEETGVRLSDGVASIDHEGIDLCIRWSSSDEAYVAEIR